ncbi:cytochrome P450 [Nocardia sp. NPDC050718]|uniref:cytochrome P450 n=1 Tax=Nocardia sp. NPDC050718 TaxID=3155788 RepID=UPI0033F724D5
MITALARQAESVILGAALRLPARPSDLAQPPAGSGLLPVRGDGGLPLVGYSLNVFDDLLGMQRLLHDRYGPVHWTSAFGTRLVLAVGEEAAGEVLANRDRTFASSGWTRFLGPFFRRGIILMDAEEHMFHRRILQQAFTRPRLVGYLATMNETIDESLARWEPSAEFMMYPTAKQLTLDIASSVFMGARLGSEARRLHRAFTTSVEATLAIVRADIPGGRWHAGLRGRKVLEEYFRSQLAAKRADPGTDLFSVLCGAKDETGAEFSDDDVVNHMIFLLMAAHDTTTTTIAMMTYFLAQRPDWQERVRAESLALGKDSLDYDDLEQLPSLDLVFKETLRMCSPVGMLAREAVADTSILGHYVPKGTLIGLALSSGHRMEPWWSDPDRFDPERFAPDRREDKRHRTTFAPFGGGAHKCIGMYFGGMEAKTILHKMLLRYAWSVPRGYLPRIGFGTGPYPVDNLPIQLARRTSDAHNHSRRSA